MSKLEGRDLGKQDEMEKKMTPRRKTGFSGGLTVDLLNSSGSSPDPEAFRVLL